MVLYKPQLRVLCVDSDDDSREMLTTFLGLENIEAITAATAAQALATVGTESFDLYLLDAWLPEMDGFELCRRLHAFDPDTPILFFAGAAYETDRKRGIEAGAGAYLYKPDIGDLVGSILQLVSKAPKPKAELMSVAMTAGMTATLTSETSGPKESRSSTFRDSLSSSRGSSNGSQHSPNSRTR